MTHKRLGIKNAFVSTNTNSSYLEPDRIFLMILLSHLKQPTAFISYSSKSLIRSTNSNRHCSRLWEFSDGSRKVPTLMAPVFSWGMREGGAQVSVAGHHFSGGGQGGHV